MQHLKQSYFPRDLIVYLFLCQFHTLIRLKNSYEIKDDNNLSLFFFYKGCLLLQSQMMQKTVASYKRINIKLVLDVRYRNELIDAFR